MASQSNLNLLAETALTAKGNASIELREQVAASADYIFPDGGFYSAEVAKRLQVTEMSLYQKAEEPTKVEARVIFETTVEPDMSNSGNHMHGGCGAYLVDICSSVVLLILAIHQGAERVHVSQAINTVYHAPAKVGCKLKIVNTTTSFGARTMTARTEIYDATNSRLVVSGVHIKMAPSRPKL